MDHISKQQHIDVITHIFTFLSQSYLYIVCSRISKFWMNCVKNFLLPINRDINSKKKIFAMRIIYNMLHNMHDRNSIYHLLSRSCNMACLRRLRERRINEFIIENKDIHIITNELKKIWPFDLISEYNGDNKRYVKKQGNRILAFGQGNKILEFGQDEVYLMRIMDTVLSLIYPEYIIYGNNNINRHDVLMPFLIDLLIKNDLRGINSKMSKINKNGKRSLRFCKGIYRKEYDLIKGPILENSIYYKKGKRYLGYRINNELSGIAIKKPSNVYCTMPKIYIFFHGKVFHKIHLIRIATEYESFLLKYKRFLPYENIYERFIWYSFSNDIFFLDDLSSKLGCIDIAKRTKLLIDEYVDVETNQTILTSKEPTRFRKTKTGSLIEIEPDHPTSHALKIPEDIPKNMQSILKEMFMDEFLENEMRTIIVQWFRKFNIKIKI